MKYFSCLCFLFSGLLSTVALGKPDRASPVSYTHLDVYKRQVLKGVRMVRMII